VANVLTENLSVIIPVLKNPIWNTSLLIFIFTGIAAMNVIGIKQGIRLVEIITLAKVLPLLFLILVGIFFISPENLNWPATEVFENFGEASLILFFAFGGGIEATLNATGEIKDPARTIPRGVLLAAIAVFTIYISIQVVSQGILGNGLPAQGETPLVAVAERIIGQSGSWLMVLGAAISCFGLISGDILATSRLPYAAARDGLLPKMMAKVHPRFATPYWAIIIYSAAGLILSLSGGFRQLAILSSAAILLVYVGVILAAIKLRKLKSENSFTIPGGLTVHILALGATVWFLSHLSRTEIVATVIFISFFSAVYYLYRSIKK
jgi:amino acid transporter